VAPQSLRDLIVPGRFVKLWCPFTDPPKEKYLLVVAIEPFLIAFLVNSELTAFQKSREDLRADHISFSGAFLHHPSQLDCSCAIHDFEIEDVCAQIEADPKRVKILAPAPMIESVKIIVEASLMIETGYKKIILRQLNTFYPAAGAPH